MANITSNLYVKGGMVMYFKWKDAYSCSNTEIDNQHKKLLEIASMIFELASQKDGVDHYDDIAVIIKELKDYTVYHFEFEEELMNRHNYDGYAYHKAEHDFFKKAIEKFDKVDIDKGQNEVMLDAAKFIADWVAGHILKTDLKCKEIFSRNE